MPESKVREVLRRFIDEITTDPMEERVVEYMIREVKKGRRVESIIRDPYISNRVNAAKLEHILTENKEIMDAVQKELEKAFGNQEFGFWDEGSEGEEPGK